MGLINYILRMVPLTFLSKLPISDTMKRWLDFIPVAVLGALLAPDLFLTNGKVNLTLSNYSLVASIPCFFIAIKTKSLIWTLIAGMAAMALLNNFNFL